MSDILILPILGMFLGLLSIVRYYIVQLKDEIKKIEKRIEILEQQKKLNFKYTKTTRLKDEIKKIEKRIEILEQQKKLNFKYTKTTRTFQLPLNNFIYLPHKLQFHRF